MKTATIKKFQQWAPAATIALTMLLSTHGALGAEDAKPKILPPNSHPYGRTYGEWSAAWWQWLFSLPTTHSPVFDTADCSAGQGGHVWFLGGTFALSGTEVRHCTIPAGTALFFPILNNWADNTGCSDSACPPTQWTVAQLRAIAKSNQDTAANMACTIDGTPLQGLSDPVNTPYRVKSQVFGYRLPVDSNNLINWLLTTFCGSPAPGCYAAGGQVYPAVADGVFLMVAPLAPGTHTIHFSGNAAGGSFTQDITYNITVTAKADKDDDEQE